MSGFPSPNKFRLLFTRSAQVNAPSSSDWKAWARVGLLALMTLLAGCGALGEPLQALMHPFAPSAHDDAIRKQAEADSFPDAKHAGL